MTTITENDIDVDKAIEDLFQSQLILWNDDHNTFQYVINLLVSLVNHSLEQAEQCAYLAHTKGKCTIKSGSLADLKPIKDSLTEGGLSVTIE